MEDNDPIGFKAVLEMLNRTDLSGLAKVWEGDGRLLLSDLKPGDVFLVLPIPPSLDDFTFQSIGNPRRGRTS